MKPSKLFCPLACALLLLPAAAQAEGKSKFGIRVTNCGFDYDAENFCSDKRMRAFAKVMKERQPNFADGLIVYIYKSRHSVINGMPSSYRMVLINPQTKTAAPFYWAFNPADQAVNGKGGHLEFVFGPESKRFCVKGNIEAYRNAYNYAHLDKPQGFCFPYTGQGSYAGFEWFEQ